jgi:uncharacterized membrane protein YeaQ/YmgE (transglycosylase-associated protein family)
MKEGTMHGIIWWILVGIIAGWLTGKIMKGTGYGFLGDLAIGILGAIAGGTIMEHLGLGGGGLIYTILVATLGAILLVFLFRLIFRKS